MRLTYKCEDSSGYGSVKLKNLPTDPLVDRLSYLDNAWEEQRNKLGQLEDIEEELGVDLLTLIKALKNGIYIKVGKQIKRTHWCISLNANGMYGERETHYWFAYRVNGFDFPDTYEKLELKDYGKTWALTKEELEK